MSFFLCNDPLEDSKWSVGFNLEEICVFSFSHTNSGELLIQLKLRDSTSIHIAGQDAVRLMYAMKITHPRVKP